MAFLDNSGDIILDAVLTDEGRRRLAMGDGSFRISRFSLGDDEIDYSLYVPATASGYEDTRILQLPVFEAFTNNTTSLKSKIISYTNNNLLYLPVVKLNNKFSATVTDGVGPVGGYYVSVDSTTTTLIGNLDKTAASANGYRFSQAGASADQSRLIFDQGLDTNALSLGYLNPNQSVAGAPGTSQDQDLFESAYLVEVDSRLLSLTTPADMSVATPSFIDDDNIATYMFALGKDSSYFAKQEGGTGGTAEPSYSIVSDTGGTRMQNSVIGPSNQEGRYGSRLVFGLRSSLNLQTSQKLFTKLGGTETITVGSTGTSFSTINTVVRVTGFNTGYRVEVPLKLLKYTS